MNVYDISLSKSVSKSTDNYINIYTALVISISQFSAYDIYLSIYLLNE